MSWQITAAAMPELSRGAAVLGTGGGGDPYVGSLFAKRAIRDHGPVEAVPLDELSDRAVVLAVAMMGAPTVLVEKVPTIAEILAPAKAITKYLGNEVTHIACFEVGGINATLPIAAAAILGLPILDADGMGRAFPELQMVIPTLYDVPASPLAVADDKGNVSIVEAVSNLWVERIARATCVQMGCSALIAGFVMDGAKAKESMVPASISHCLQIGEAVSMARQTKLDPVAAVTEVLGGRELFTGKVVDVERRTTGGFARGSARFVSLAGTADEFTIAFQNEHLIAKRGDDVLVTVPDLIIVLEADTGEPITTETMRYGQRTRVIAAPADPRWHTPAGLALVGPQYFGYDVPPHRFDGTVGATS